MKLKRSYIITLLFSIMFLSCSQSSKKEITDQGVTIRFKIEDLSNTKLKFGIRAVGLDKTRGFHIVMTVDDRPKVVLYQNLNLASKPQKEYLNKIVSSIEASVSPNGKHFAVYFKDTTDKVYMYHLFPVGPPFRVDEYDNIVSGTDLKSIAWDKLPEPEKIAYDFIKAGMKESKRYPIPNDELWNAVLATMPGSIFDELIVSCWPNVIETQYLVDSLIDRNTDYNNSFFNTLGNKAEELVKNDSLNSSIIHVIMVGYRLGRENPALFDNLIKIWPESPSLDEFVRQNYDKFPESIRTRIIEKSIYYDKHESANYYKSSNKKFLRDFVDSTEI